MADIPLQKAICAASTRAHAPVPSKHSPIAGPNSEAGRNYPFSKSNLTANALPRSIKNANHSEQRLSDNFFNKITELLCVATGISLQPTKRQLVEIRVSKRLKHLKISNFQEYLEYIVSPIGKSEHEHLINALTTNLTRFFRENHHFNYLDEVISRSKFTPSESNPLRIWSAGCSSGEEPYSIAMTLWQNQQFIGLNNVKILATDIDTQMLANGALGQYSQQAVQDLPENHKCHFQELDNETVQISDDIKSGVYFRRLNLIEAWPISKQMNAIFCRNVSIYFDRDTQKTIFERLARLLKPEGILFVGHSENLNMISNKFQLIEKSTYRYLG